MNHDSLVEELRCWLLIGDGGMNLRPPGVKENLFHLSGYLSDKEDVPSKDVLMFLHAYIFALEGASCSLHEQLRRCKERKLSFPPQGKWLGIRTMTARAALSETPTTAQP